MKLEAKRLTGMASALLLAMAMSGADATADGSLSKRGGAGAPTQNPGGRDACAVVEKFVDSFRDKVDEIVYGSMQDNLLDPIDPAAGGLGRNPNPYLDEFVRILQRRASVLAGQVADDVKSVIDPFLDRVARRLCLAADAALRAKGSGGLGVRITVRRALCDAVDGFIPHIEKRVMAAAALRTQAVLAAAAPSIPEQEAALMGPVERQRIESEIAWYVEILTHAIMADVESEVAGFYDRVRARKCP